MPAAPRIGFCLLSWTANAAEMPLDFFRTLRAIGYDGVEIPIPNAAPEDIRKLARMLAAADLRSTALTVMPPGTNPVGDSPLERQAALARIAAAIDLAHGLGADALVGPIHQTLGAFTGAGASPLELDRLSDFHRYAGDLASKRAMKIAVEAMVRFECHLFNRFDDLAGYLRRLGHPGVTGLFDTFHANLEELAPVDSMRRNIDQVGHFHVSENDRGIPGRGHVPWPDYFDVLRRSGYSGWITAEIFGRADPEFAGRARVWRELPGSLEDICAETYAHIRRGWEAAARPALTG